MSKGSTQRPRSVADEEWATRWNNIFGRDVIDNFKQLVKEQQHEQDQNILESDTKEDS